VLRRLEKTFKALFTRSQGFRAVAPLPRRRIPRRYGLTIKDGRIGLVGVAGDIKVRRHRSLPGKPRSAILTRQAGKWYVVIRKRWPNQLYLREKFGRPYGLL
jgi:hypothetical protein